MCDRTIKRKLLPSEIEEEKNKTILTDCSSISEGFKEGEFIIINGIKKKITKRISDTALQYSGLE